MPKMPHLDLLTCADIHSYNIIADADINVHIKAEGGIQMEAERTERRGAIQWVKEHKTVLIAIGVGAIGTFFVAKNWNSIKGLFKASESAPCAIEKAATTVKETVVPTIPKDVLDNLTGNKLTARALGDKMGCTAQEINKRICTAGLAVKHPCGGYIMTEAGRLLGEETVKTTKYDYTFSNIEWDEKILELLFSKEELLEIAAKEERMQQILAKSA